MKKVLYPGSFDPITMGHMNIIEQATDLFDEVIVAVMKNPFKSSGMFTIEERFEIISKIYEGFKNIKVISGEGAAVDIAVANECKAILRGLRNITDYESEIQLAQINKDISNNEINTVCLFADKEYEYVSSSMVKEIMRLGKPIDKYVHPMVLKVMVEKIKM